MYFAILQSTTYSDVTKLLILLLLLRFLGDLLWGTLCDGTLVRQILCATLLLIGCYLSHLTNFNAYRLYASLQESLLQRHFSPRQLTWLFFVVAILAISILHLCCPFLSLPTYFQIRARI